jgi:signal transduction histidine kinase
MERNENDTQLARAVSSPRKLVLWPQALGHKLAYPLSPLRARAAQLVKTWRNFANPFADQPPLPPKPRRFLAVAPWPRALAETLLLAGIFIGISVLNQYQSLSVSQISERTLFGGSLNLLATIILLIGPAGCALWMALRLRMPPTPWYRALPGEALFGVLMALAPSAVLLAIFYRLSLDNPARAYEYMFADAVISGIFVIAFIVYRTSVRLWLWWDGLRRRRLQWALTHALLSVAVVGAALVGLSVLGLVLLATHNNAPLLQWITAMIFLAALIIIGALLVLPPIVVFSYLFARSASRRLLRLVHATEQLREGDLSARAPVEGDDEVAQLQRNFNAMAENLEQGVHELRAERDEVARLLQQRRELIASVSHELRTPVATLRGYLESANRLGEEANPETLRRDLDVMLHETQRLQGLIDDLFTLARAEVGRLDLTLEAVDVGALARRAVETVTPLAWRASRVEVIARVAPETPLAMADAARLEQALHNLLRNAMRHTQPGGIIVVVAAMDGAECGKGPVARSASGLAHATDAVAPKRIALRVRDTGEGIAEEDLPHIWERFYRADRARELDATGGSGLGLALVKEVIEAMGGSVAVESALGQGSAFSLLLPLAPATNDGSVSGVRRTPAIAAPTAEIAHIGEMR